VASGGVCGHNPPGLEVDCTVDVLAARATFAPVGPDVRRWSRAGVSRPAVMIIESADAPIAQLILRNRLSMQRAGEPLGRVGDGSAMARRRRSPHATLPRSAWLPL